MLTSFQDSILQVIGRNRSPDSHVAGGTALNADRDRYSRDIDIFHDVEESVQTCAEADISALREAGFVVTIERDKPAHVSAVVSRGGEETRIDWTADSAWRFLPAVKDERFGWRLHDIDLALNKVLALAGRREPRDLVDIVECDRAGLPFEALIWAAPAKDSGFNPVMILNEIARNSKVVSDRRLRTEVDSAVTIDPVSIKSAMLEMLRRAEAAIETFDPETVGQLFLDAAGAVHLPPKPGETSAAKPHRAQLKGSWPEFMPVHRPHSG